MRIAVLALAGATTAASAPASANDVTITVTDLRNHKGVVRACMTMRADVFPKCIKDPGSHRSVVPADGTVKITFKGVKPGDYAIALLHDENEDGKANRALGMMPKEGYGFSRDAPVHMAPPKFEDAVFRHGKDAQAFTIKMRYFL